MAKIWIQLSTLLTIATIGLFLLIILFKFIVKGASGFLRYSSVNFIYIQLLFKQAWSCQNVLINKILDLPLI